MDDEAFWSNDPKVLQDSEWDRISSGFTNAGYREGITAGKESALQEGFDSGFATVGAPLGRELGILRGLCSALLAFLGRPSHEEGDASTTQARSGLLEEVRSIASALADIRFSDIVPSDWEAIAHAREHLGGDGVDKGDNGGGDHNNGGGGGGDDDVSELLDVTKMNEEIKDKRDMEGLEDLMAQMNAAGGGGGNIPVRPTADDVARLKARLMNIAQNMGLALQYS